MSGPGGTTIAAVFKDSKHGVLLRHSFGIYKKELFVGWYCIFLKYLQTRKSTITEFGQMDTSSYRSLKESSQASTD